MKANSALREIRRLRRDRTGIAREPMRSQNITLTQASSTASTASLSTSSRSDSSKGSSISQKILNSSSGNRRRRVGDYHDNYEGVESLTWSLRNSLKERFGTYHIRSTQRVSKLIYNGPLFRRRGRHTHENDDDEESNLYFREGRYRLSKILQDREEHTDSDDNSFLHSLECKKKLRRLMNFITISLLVASFTTLLFFNDDNGNRGLIRYGLITSDEKNNTIIERKITHGLSMLNSLSNLTTSYNPENETAFLLDVPLTGSDVVKKSISKCYNLTMASEYGLRQPDYDEDKLGVFQSKIDGSYIGKFVNVDLSTVRGIKRAQRLKLMEHKVADVISMGMLYENDRIFDKEKEKRGRMFVMFADPIHRAIGHYHFISNATWSNEYNPKVNKMSLDDYAESKYVQNNPIVRLLTNTIGSKEVTEVDLELAKRIIQLKCLVGLYDDIDESVSRFDRYFSWEVLTSRKRNGNGGSRSPEKQKQIAKERKEEIMECSKGVNQAGNRWLDMQTTIKGTRVQKGSDVWNKLTQSNQLDLKLYEYAKVIYNYQAKHIFDAAS